MTAKTDIWMPLYVADYLSSTTRLTTEQHGAYLLLIIDYWKNGRLPDDDSVLSSITRLTAEAWAKHKGVLQGFFEVVDGEWVHSRIEAEIEKSGDLKLAKIKKSILGNYARYGKVDPRVFTEPALIDWWASQPQNKTPKDSPRDTIKDPPSPSPSHLSKDKNIYTPSRKRDSLFDAFWQAYPRKVGKDAARKAFDRRKPDDELLDKMLKAISDHKETQQWKAEGGKFIPHPSTWLNEGRWQDEVETEPVSIFQSMFGG